MKNNRLVENANYEKDISIVKEKAIHNTFCIYHRKKLKKMQPLHKNATRQTLIFKKKAPINMRLAGKQ